MPEYNSGEIDGEREGRHGMPDDIHHHTISLMRKPWVVGSSMSSFSCGRREARAASVSGDMVQFTSLSTVSLEPPGLMNVLL